MDWSNVTPEELVDALREVRQSLDTAIGTSQAHEACMQLPCTSTAGMGWTMADVVLNTYICLPCISSVVQ